MNNGHFTTASLLIAAATAAGAAHAGVTGFVTPTTLRVHYTNLDLELADGNETDVLADVPLADHDYRNDDPDFAPTPLFPRPTAATGGPGAALHPTAANALDAQADGTLLFAPDATLEIAATKGSRAPAGSDLPGLVGGINVVSASGGPAGELVSARG